MAEHLRSGERGATLPELLVAIVLIGLIGTVTGAAFAVSLRATDQASGRFAESHASQQLGTFLVSDVQGAARVGDATLATGCAEHADDVLRVDGHHEFQATYRLVGTDLHRTACGGPAPGNLTVARDVAAVAAWGAPGKVSLIVRTQTGRQYIVQANVRSGSVLLLGGS